MCGEKVLNIEDLAGWLDLAETRKAPGLCVDCVDHRRQRRLHDQQLAIPRLHRKLCEQFLLWNVPTDADYTFQSSFYSA